MNRQDFLEEITRLGLIITKEQEEQLEKFYELLIQWNEKMNLTRIIEKEEVYLKHFYDSLTLVKVIDLSKVETLCDVGSGAGFPGIVLKIMFPNLKVTLVDSLLKRVNYLNEVISELKLKNICAIHSRAEDYGQIKEECFDVVTARAVANLSTLLNYCLPLVKKNGYFIAMKGRVEEELENFYQVEKQFQCQLVERQEFLLPLEGSVRNLLKIKKLEKTPIRKKKIARKAKKML